MNEVNVYSVPSEVTRFDRFIHMRADGPRKGHKHATYTTHRAWHTLPYTSLVVSLVVCDLLNSHLRRRGNETVEFRCVGGASWLGWRHRRRWFTKRRRTEGNKNVTSTAAGNCCWFVSLITGRARRLTKSRPTCFMYYVRSFCSEVWTGPRALASYFRAHALNMGPHQLLILRNSGLPIASAAATSLTPSFTLNK